MRSISIVPIMLCSLMILTSCDIGNNDNDIKNGVIQFQTLNSISSVNKSTGLVTVLGANPALTGSTTETLTTSFILTIGDVWVSQQEVKAGNSDHLDWVRLTAVTNKEPKLFEDYTFSAMEIPEGTYKSIKITFRNVFYRYAQLVSDPMVKYELLETMGSWTDACDVNDTTWAKTNYFGTDGNHLVNDLGVFELVAPGEKIDGFSIEAGKTALVGWRLGAGVTTPCTTYLIDENENLTWDCGIDRMDFVCPPDAIYMWDFVIEYQ